MCQKQKEEGKKEDTASRHMAVCRGFNSFALKVSMRQAKRDIEVEGIIEIKYSHLRLYYLQLHAHIDIHITCIFLQPCISTHSQRLVFLCLVVAR